MPWLYSGPDDNVCQLRGVGGDVEDGGAGGDDAGSDPPAAICLIRQNQSV